MASKDQINIGRRLIHDVVDAGAAKNPSKVVFEYQACTGADWRPVNYALLQTAMNRMAWWLTDAMKGYDSGSFCYVGPPDVRYYVITLGASKASLKVSFPMHIVFGGRFLVDDTHAVD